MLSRLLTVLALTGLGFAAIGDEYRPACKAVEVAISNASRVYYAGEYDYGQLLRWQGWSSRVYRQPLIHQRKVPSYRI